MSSNNPFSVRLGTSEKALLEELGKGSISKGIHFLIEFYQTNKSSISEGATPEQHLRMLQEEIEGLKKSPFGFDKKEISELEKELNKALSNFKKRKTESLKDSILKLIKSAG